MIAQGNGLARDTGYALEIGHFDPGNGDVVSSTRFYGNGGVWHNSGRQVDCMSANRVQVANITTNGPQTINWDTTNFSGSGGGMLVVNVSVPSGIDTPITINPLTSSLTTFLGPLAYEDGDRLTLIIRRTSTSANVTFSFPGDFVFYGDDDYINPSPRRPYAVKFELVWENGNWRVTRRDLDFSFDAVLTCSIDDPRADFVGIDSLERAILYANFGFTGTIRLYPSNSPTAFEISQDLGFDDSNKIRIVGEGRAFVTSTGGTNAIRLESEDTDISFENIEFRTVSDPNAVVLVAVGVKALFKNCTFRGAGPSLQVFERVLFEDCEFFNRASTALNECVGIDAGQTDGMGTIDFVRCRIESGGGSVAGVLHFNVSTDIAIQAINFVDCYFLNDTTSFTGAVSPNVGPHPLKVTDVGGFNCTVRKISFARCIMAGSVGMYMPTGNGVSWNTVEVVDCEVYVRDAANRSSKAVAIECDDLLVRNLKIGASDTINGTTELVWKTRLANPACDDTVATGFSSYFPSPQEDICGNVTLVGRNTIDVDGIIYKTEQYSGADCPDVTIVQGSSSLRVMRIGGVDVPIESVSGVDSSSAARVCILAYGSSGGSFSCRDVSIRGAGARLASPTDNTGIFTLMVSGVWDNLSPAMVFDNISVRSSASLSDYGIGISHNNRGTYPVSGSRTVWNNIHVQGGGDGMAFGFFTTFDVSYASAYLRINGGVINDVQRGVLIESNSTANSSVDLVIDGLTVEGFSVDGLTCSWEGSTTPGPVITGCRVQSNGPSGNFYQLGSLALTNMFGVFTGNTARVNQATIGNLLATADNFFFVGMEVGNSERYGSGSIAQGVKSTGLMNYNEAILNTAS